MLMEQEDEQKLALSMYKSCLQVDGPRSLDDDSVKTVELMNIDQCRRVPELEDSQLVGVSVKLASDADVAERGLGCLPDREVKVDIKVEETSFGKRKRGRPPRAQSKTPPLLRKKNDDEDVCFICFDGGSLVLCDRRGCPKAYHPTCIKRDEAFFRSKAKWNCGWHICSTCRKASHYMCYTCTYSLCKGCTKDADYLRLRGNMGFCGTCMRTIMLIENCVQGDKETCQVDFDDKSSWEYLFKVYWVYLKRKLSLTLDELARAKNPWKEAAVMGGKVKSSSDLYHGKDNKNSGLDNSCVDMEANKAERRQTKKMPEVLKKEDFPSMKYCGGHREMPLSESMNWATKELLDFVAHMKNGDTSVVSQFDVQALLLEYIKINNLRDPRQKCQIVCDSRLISLFGKARVGHIEMLKLLEFHFLIKENSPAENTTRVGVLDDIASQVEANGSYNNQLMMSSNKRRKTRKKADVQWPKNNGDAYAAIDAHNINLIYLRRNLMENLIEDCESFHEKVIGSVVRIRIPGSDQKQDIYRLVQVVGTSKVAEPYKIGTRMTNVMLEIINLDKKELISIDGISNQEFSEDECRRLRQCIKCGLSKRLSVGEIQEKVVTLQAVRVIDVLEAEILRLSHLRDRASEKGHRKELRECVEKLQLLKSPEERHRRLHDIPEVHSDINMDPNCESDEGSGKLGEKNQDDNITSKNPGLNIKEGDRISPRSGADDLSTVGSNLLNISATTIEQSDNRCKIINHINPSASGNAHCNNAGVVRSKSVADVALDISPLNLSSAMEQSLNDFETEKVWHYQDPTEKIQGPFAMWQLRKWSTSGHFPPDLRIWPVDEKRDDSVLLTDALNGKCFKNVSLLFNNQLSMGVDFASDDRYISCHRGGNRRTNDIYTNSKSIEGRWNQNLDDPNVHCNSHEESVRSNGWDSYSTSWMGHSGIFEKSQDSSKCDISSHDKPQFCHSLPSTAFAGESHEALSDQVTEGYQMERYPDDSNEKQNSNKTSEGQSNNRQGYQKQPDSESHSDQSSGKNWTRPPGVNGSSSCLDSNSTFVSVTKGSQQQEIDFPDLPSPTPVSSSNCWDSTSAFVSVTKTSPQNQEIDFEELPPTPKPSNEKLESQVAENIQSVTSEIPVQDAGPSWSTASSLVADGPQLPEVAVEWRGYSPTSAKPSVEKWDPGLVSASSLKSTEILDDHAATPTSISGQLIHSSPSHLSCNPSSWQAIISEPNEFSSLGDESVSDLLAEVEAMESLVGLESPTSIMNCGEEFTEGPKNDCPISSEGLSPVPDPSKGDALSSTADIQPSQSTAKDEQQVVYQVDMLHLQRISGSHCSTSAEADVDTKNTKFSSSQWQAGSGLPSTVPSKATLDMAATDTKWRLESGSLNTTWGATKENESFSCSGLDQGNPNIGLGVGQGTIEENGGINSCTSIGNPGIQGNQTRYGSDRFYASRDRSSHGRDSGSGSGRTAWNRQPLFTVGNGGGSFRPLPKGQRICKFHESGYCKKGASCSYLHP